MRKPNVFGSIALGAAFCACATLAQAADAAPGSAEAHAEIVRLAQTGLAYAGVLTAAGTVSMAVVELIKGLLDLRTRFQRRLLNQWLGPNRAEVLPELLYLAIGDRSHESVLCGQPIEKMMGQLQAAARIALEYPERFPQFFTFLTTTDFEQADQRAPVRQVAPDDRATWARHAQAVRDVQPHLGRHLAPGTAPANASANAPVVVAEQGPTPSASDAAQARARLATLVARKLDGFQLRTDFWWTRFNQGLGIGVSIVLMVVVLKDKLHMDFPSALTLGILGGLLAPFAKDFSQALSKFANK